MNPNIINDIEREMEAFYNMNDIVAVYESEIGKVRNMHKYQQISRSISQQH